MKAGWEVIKPAKCTGVSGVEHRFTFLASKDGRLYGFDLYPDIGEVEVLKTFIKEMDSKASVYLVCLKGRPTERGSTLASEYGIRILSPADIGTFFDMQMVEAKASKQTRPQRDSLTN